MNHYKATAGSTPACLQTMQPRQPVRGCCHSPSLHCTCHCLEARRSTGAAHALADCSRGVLVSITGMLPTTLLVNKWYKTAPSQTNARSTVCMQPLQQSDTYTLREEKRTIHGSPNSGVAAHWATRACRALGANARHGGRRRRTLSDRPLRPAGQAPPAPNACMR